MPFKTKEEKNKYQRAWRKLNPTKTSEYIKKHRNKTGVKEKTNQYRKKYALEHKDEINKKRREKRKSNLKFRTKLNKQTRDWKQKNKPKIKEGSKKYYLGNKDKILKRNKLRHKENMLNPVYAKKFNDNQARKQKIKRENKQKYKREFKKNKSCSKCGYNEYTDILQFHHRNPKNKKITLGASKVYNFKQMVEEIKKCILLCPNCHFYLEFKKRTKTNNLDNEINKI